MAHRLKIIKGGVCTGDAALIPGWSSSHLDSSKSISEAGTAVCVVGALDRG
jgi:hypothetical protein